MSTPTPYSDNSWRMFRIMGEFAQGFEALDQFPRGIAIFGSARTPAEDPYYQAAVDIAGKVVGRGFSVITGGGPGIMEAGNKGAKEAGGSSVGLCIKLPHEQSGNEYITDSLDFRYFFVRKVMFLKNTCAAVVMPGGFGTMDELMETLTLVQTGKIKKMPVILYGSKFWNGMLEWLHQVMEIDNRYISPGDLELMKVVDSPEEVMAALEGLTPDEVDNELTNAPLELPTAGNIGESHR